MRYLSEKKTLINFISCNGIPQKIRHNNKFKDNLVFLEFLHFGKSYYNSTDLFIFQFVALHNEK